MALMAKVRMGQHNKGIDCLLEKLILGSVKTSISAMIKHEKGRYSLYGNDVEPGL